MILLRWALLPLAVTLATAVAGPAAAEEPITSGNVKYLGNIKYPIRGGGEGSQSGTDLEFATITVAAPATPAAPAAPAAVAPTIKPIASKAKANAKKYAACTKKARKIKNKRKRAKALKACKKRYKSAKAKRSLADVDGRRAGLQRTYSFAGSYNNGLQIIDVSDPASPELVTTYDCAITQGDPFVFQRPDLGGRWFVTYTSDGGASDLDSECVKDADAAGSDASGRNGSGTYIIEVTDPESPKAVSFAYFEKGSHNQTVDPSGKFLYNSNSDLVTDPTPGIEVVDISDITKPKDVTVLDMLPLPGLGSNAHDIWFRPDGKRAYAAAVSQTVVINTEDPANPSIISRIPSGDYTVSHQAETSDDTVGNCTSHVYQIHREANLMIIGWYNAGFRVLDLTSLAGVSFGAQGTGIKEVAFGRFPAGTVWAAKSPKVTAGGSFPVYSNDEKRGFDTWTVDLAQPARRRESSIRFSPAGLEPQAHPGLGAAAFICRLGARDL